MEPIRTPYLRAWKLGKPSTPKQSYMSEHYSGEGRNRRSNLLKFSNKFIEIYCIATDFLLSIKAYALRRKMV